MPAPPNKEWSTQPQGGRSKGYAQWRPQKKTQVILAQSQEVLREYHNELPMTARQIFYRLVGAYGYPKTEADYKKLKDILVNARRAKMIGFEDMRDDGATVMSTTTYDGTEEFLASVRAEARSYNHNKLLNQDLDIRVYCEAGGMMNQLYRVTKKYSIPVYSCGGFDSLTAKYDLAKEVAANSTYHDRDTVILHLGDHDPSGVKVYESLRDDVHGFLEVDLPNKRPRDVALFRRVALTLEQIEEHDLPLTPAKDSSHSEDWGDLPAVQLEALPPDVVSDILDEAIQEFLDPELLEESYNTEKAVRQELLALMPPAA